MSDFVFSSNSINKNIITNEIQSIYDGHFPTVLEYHGHWGSAGVSVNPYNGFLPYEEDKYIVFVVGGPLLMFRDNSFLSKEDSNEGTKAIFDRWLVGDLKYDSDLSGPFAILIINKKSSEVQCITDMMSFLPVYQTSVDTGATLSTHVDVLARLTNNNKQFDKVSLVDFILHGITTYPYTMYENILQMAPSSVHTLSEKNKNTDAKHYWLPVNRQIYKSIKQASYDLRGNLEGFINKLTKETNNIAQFLSGGEDSRMLSGILYGCKRDGHTFLDNINIEGKIAQKVAEIYDVNLRITTRDPMHYFKILPNCSNLIGSGAQYRHGHTYGFHKSCRLDSYVAVFGGLLSDALLKGTRIKKIKGSVKFPFLPDIKSTNFASNQTFTHVLFTDSVMECLSKRKQSHLNYIKKIRKESAEEWFDLWPSSMNNNIPNIAANRRLFCSYEPFTSSEVVKLSASVPQKWKLNRKLFCMAARPYLKRSKHLIHSNGIFPYYSWKINIFVQFSIWSYRQIAKRSGIIKGNQGPWGDWRRMIKKEEWDEFIKSHLEHSEIIPFKNIEEQLTKLVKKGVLEVNQYVNLSQLLYEIDKNIDS